MWASRGTITDQPSTTTLHFGCSSDWDLYAQYKEEPDPSAPDMMICSPLQAWPTQKPWASVLELTLRQSTSGRSSLDVVRGKIGEIERLVGGLANRHTPFLNIQFSRTPTITLGLRCFAVFARSYGSLDFAACFNNATRRTDDWFRDLDNCLGTGRLFGAGPTVTPYLNVSTAA